MNKLTRRCFGQTLLASGTALFGSTRLRCFAQAPNVGNDSRGRLLFVSQGKTFLYDLATNQTKEFRFEVPNQATWQAAGNFPDGNRILLLSMEPRRDGPGRPFDEYYTQTPTHIWVHDLQSGSLTELATVNRQAVFYTPQLLLGSDRMLVQIVKDRVGQIVNMALDGSDQIDFTQPGEGLPYGCDLSPDGKRIAFHLASPQGYQIWTSDLKGQARVQVAAQKDHLFFGPKWSPDGEWLTFQDCHHPKDPGHDWSDIVISRPDGTEKRHLTQGQSHWFGATYGAPGNRGGGSNMLAWTHDGRILYSPRLPDSVVPWQYQAQRRDTDHFNREYRPALSRGGTELHRLDPKTGESVQLTKPGAGYWDCRPTESPDKKSIAFCRAKTGEMPEVWLMTSTGSHSKPLTKGHENSGADHPQWLGRT